MGEKSLAVHKLEQAVELVNEVSHEQVKPDGVKGSVKGIKFTPPQVRDFMKTFHMFDRDNDNSLNERELASVFRALGQNPTSDELRKFIEEVDTNGNGKLEEEEFFSLLKEHMQSRDEVEQELASAFRVFDKDGDGKLTKRELVAVLRICGDPLKPDEAIELMQQMDKNEDGFIDIKEFTSFLCSGYAVLEPIEKKSASK